MQAQRTSNYGLARGRGAGMFAPRGALKSFAAPCVAAILATIAVIAIPPPAHAKIDLVTIPARDKIQLTIYNSEDLTLVRESRQLTFSKGLNPIQFSWAGTLIDPTSLQLEFTERADQFQILDITYPANTENVLIWNVEAKEAGPARIEIMYFTSGITWEADYVLRANAAETEAGLEGYVRVTNRSGEDFENAETRLVVGTINLVEKIAALARRGIIPEKRKDNVRQEAAREMMFLADQVRAMPAAASMKSSEMAGIAEVKEVVKQAISEYQLYTIEGTEDLPNNWSKRLRSFSKDAVKIEVAYELDERKYGPEIIKFYKSKNDKEHGFGDKPDPLPEGTFRALRDDGAGGLAWAGQHNNKYVPVGEKIELNLGPDGMITLEPKMMDFKRRDIDFDSFGNVVGWITDEQWTLELRNSRRGAVPVKVARYFDGDWEIDPKIDAKTVKFTKKDIERVEFETTLEPLSKREISYLLTTRFGSRSRATAQVAPGGDSPSAQPPQAPPQPRRPRRAPR